MLFCFDCLSLCLCTSVLVVACFSPDVILELRLGWQGVVQPRPVDTRKILLTASGIIAHIVPILEAHNDNEAVVSAALLALRGLTRLPIAVSVLASCPGALPWVMHNIRRHVSWCTEFPFSRCPLLHPLDANHRVFTHAHAQFSWNPH